MIYNKIFFSLLPASRQARTLILLLLPPAYCLLPDSPTAQTAFERTYGGPLNDEGYSVQETSDGGYIVAGSTESFGNGGKDVYLIKTDAFGDTLWTKTFGGTEEDQSFSVTETRDGGFILAGWTLSYGSGGKDVYLIKTDSLGIALWTKTFGGTSDDESFSVEETSDGGVIVAGRSLSFGLGNWDFYVIRTDSTGDTLWTRTYGSTAEDHGLTAEESSDGGFIISGFTSVFGNRNIYLIKTNSFGDTLWTKTYGGANWDVGYSVRETQDGDYVIGGYTNSFGSGLYDFYLIKTDSLGISLWTKTYGGASSEYGYDTEETLDKGYILAGRTNTFGAGSIDFYLIKTDSLGDTLWTRTFGGPLQDIGRSVSQTSDEGYILSGYTDSFGAGGNDVYLIKVDKSGLGVEEENSAFSIQHSAFRLFQNHPNPFSSTTLIQYQIPMTNDKFRMSNIRLAIYDLTGRIVVTLEDNIQTPGVYSVIWDGHDKTGKALPSGVYFYHLKTRETHHSPSITKRLILLR